MWAPDGWPHGGSHPHQFVFLRRPTSFLSILASAPIFLSVLVGGDSWLDHFPHSHLRLRRSDRLCLRHAHHVRRQICIYRYSSFLFHFVGSTEKVNRVKGKTRFLMSSYTYLALRISNPVGAKLSRWRLGINSFGANWDLRRSYTQCGHCHAGAKLSLSYFGIISSRRQISSTYGFYTT